jgi:hypothetical protein
MRGLHRFATAPLAGPGWCWPCLLSRNKQGMVRSALLWCLSAAAAAAVVAAAAALAQQPIRPLPKVGSCPLGYYSSGGICMPSTSGNTRGAIEKTGNSCPLGFYASGNYCVSSPSNDREAIEKTGKSCPLGWFSSGGYCVKSR